MTENIGVLGKKKSPQPTGVERIVNAPLPTVYGDFQAVGYLDHDRGDEQALSRAAVEPGDPHPGGVGELVDHPDRLDEAR